jgi:hypothetical protein
MMITNLLPGKNDHANPKIFFAPSQKRCARFQPYILLTLDLREKLGRFGRF